MFKRLGNAWSYVCSALTAFGDSIAEANIRFRREHGLDDGDDVPPVKVNRLGGAAAVPPLGEHANGAAAKAAPARRSAKWKGA